MAIYNNTTAQKFNLISKIEPYKRQYRYTGFFSRITGAKDSCVWGKLEVKNLGDQIVFNMQQFKFPVIYSGTGGQNPYYDHTRRLISDGRSNVQMGTDAVKMEQFRFDSKIINARADQQSTGHDFWPDVQYNLIEQGRRLKDLRFKNAIINAYSGNGDENDGSHTAFMYTPARITEKLAAGSFAAQNNTRLSVDRFMMGKVGNPSSIAGDTVGAKATVLNSTDVIGASNVLNAEFLYKLSVLAAQGQHTGTVEAPLEPHSYVIKNGYQRRSFILVTSESAFRSLRKDPEWVAQTTRGVIESEMQPSAIFGSDYKGCLYGIDVVVDRSMEDMVVAAAPEGVGYVVKASVLLGAGAFGYGIGGEPLLIQDEDDYAVVKGICHDEISGIKVLKFPTLAEVPLDHQVFGGNPYPMLENGMIHVLTTVGTGNLAPEDVPVSQGRRASQHA